MTIRYRGVREVSKKPLPPPPLRGAKADTNRVSLPCGCSIYTEGGRPSKEARAVFTGFCLAHGRNQPLGYDEL